MFVPGALDSKAEWVFPVFAHKTSEINKWLREDFGGLVCTCGTVVNKRMIQFDYLQ